MQSESDNSIRNTPGVSVHSGFPNPATDARLESLDLNQLLIQHTASTFLMRIDGNDWQASGIFSGDIALVDKALSPRAGDTVVWWNDGTFAISNFSKTTEGTAIWGVVTAVIHQLRRSA